MNLLSRVSGISFKLAKLCGLLVMIRCFGQDNTFCMLSSMAMVRDRLLVARDEHPARRRAVRWVNSRVISCRENQYGP